MLGSMSEKMVMTEDGFFDLLGFLVSSAQLSLAEPDAYPVLRLASASSRLIKSVIETGQIQDEGHLNELLAKLDECVDLVGEDEDQLRVELENAVLLMTREMIRRSKV